MLGHNITYTDKGLRLRLQNGLLCFLVVFRYSGMFVNLAIVYKTHFIAVVSDLAFIVDYNVIMKVKKGQGYLAFDRLRVNRVFIYPCLQHISIFASPAVIGSVKDDNKFPFASFATCSSAQKSVHIL